MQRKRRGGERNNETRCFVLFLHFGSAWMLVEVVHFYFGWRQAQEKGMCKPYGLPALIAFFLYFPRTFYPHHEPWPLS